MGVGRWIWFSLGLAGILFVAGVFNGFLAPLKVHKEFTPQPAQRAGYAEPREKISDPVIGLALSGGGARAAVFAAAGMQALAARGLLEPVTHVSSVSGGGFAASYLATHPLPDCSAHTKVDPRRACYAPYFAKMQDRMRHNYLWDTEMGQIKHPARVFSPSRRIVSLQEALDTSDYLKGRTFGSLEDGRAYFFNAVSYDTGQRFVFSNLAVGDPLDESEHVLPATVRSLSFSDPKTLRPTPETLPLSLAVATSAAFPPYLGPTTIAVMGADGKRKEFWHLGDGGVFENTGVEMLREVVMADAASPAAILYVFNAGQRLDKDLSKNTHDLSIWSRQVTRLVDVLLEYAGGHREALTAELLKKSGLDITQRDFDYLHVAKILDENPTLESKLRDWSNFKEDCGWWARLGVERPADQLADVPTALKITKCDAALMTQAAEFLVDQTFPIAQY